MNKEFQVDQLNVCRFDTRAEMGAAGAQYAAAAIRRVCEEKGEANIIFAASPSQIDVLDALRNEDVDWRQVNAYHMDEYVGLSRDHPASFAHYLQENFFQYLSFKSVNYLDGTAPDPAAECQRYSALLREHPVDITLAGIGENGHMAFNDPYLADFFDRSLVKVNPHLDSVCQQQQVNDGWFPTLAEVPSSAMTLTFPALLQATYLIVTAPADSKKEIIKKTLEGPIGLAVPATSARLHRNAVLYIDAASAALL